jgi:hypothetical protein
VSSTDTVPLLVHVRYTTMRLPAVLALLKARLLSVPEVISFARTCLKVGLAAAALAGVVIRGKPRKPSVAANRTATAARREPGRM